MPSLTSIADNPSRLALSLSSIILGFSLATCGGGSGAGPAGGGGGGGGGSSKLVLYVASGANGQGEILAFTADSSTGKLSSPISFPAPQVLSQMIVDPSGKFLYATDFDAGGVRSFSINSSTGALTETVGSPFKSPLVFGNGGPLAVSPDGRFLFFSDASGDITTFTVSAGSLTPTAAVMQDMNQPNQFAVDPAGKFLYVANLSDTSTGDQFSVFAIDAATGALSTVAGSPFHFQSNSEPFGIVVHPNGNFVYSSLSNSSGLEAMSADRGSGMLALLPNSPLNTGLIPEQVAITPSGNFLYVCTHGLGSIVPFSVNPTTGALTQLVANTGGNPTQIAFDPAGKFLFTPYPGLHEVAIYPIDQASGNALQPALVQAGAVTGAIALVKLR